MRRLYLLMFAAISAAAQAQVPDEVVATFIVDGNEQQISAVDLSLELARRDRHRPRGQEAIDHLVLRTLVSNAAAIEGVTPTKPEIKARVEELRRELDAHDIKLDEYLAQKNVTYESFARDYIALSIAHEKLVMKSAELRRRDQVTPDLLKLWLEEARAKAGVVVEASALSPGVVASVGDQRLMLADLGDLLRQNASPETRDNAIRQIVVRRLLDAAAKRHAIEISQAEMDAEVERRRRLIEADPQFQGIPYKELLKSQGTSLEELRRSPVIRAQVQRHRLLAIEFSDAKLDEHLSAHRSEVLKTHGPQRHIHVILIRAATEPNEFITLDFDQALEQAKFVKQRMTDGMSFGVAARIHSEDPNSKVRGGDVGRQPFNSTSLPREVVDAAYHLDPFVVSDPIRTNAGYYLAMISEIEDAPTDEVLRQRLRAELGADFVREMIEAAEIRVTHGTTAQPK